MARERYSEDHLLFYPGAGLSPAEKQRMDRYEVLFRRRGQSIKRVQVDLMDLM